MGAYIIRLFSQLPSSEEKFGMYISRHSMRAHQVLRNINIFVTYIKNTKNMYREKTFLAHNFFPFTRDIKNVGFPCNDFVST